MKNKSSSAWSAAKSEEHYGFKRWGSGHLAVDDEGFVTVQPLTDGRGIRVLDVAPGYIVTDLNREAMTRGPLAEYLKKRIPGGSTGTTSDVAKLVAAIFSEAIPFLSGETIYLDGAQGINH